MFEKGDELIHPNYGKCILFEEAKSNGECVVIFDKPITSNITELVTDISILKRKASLKYRVYDTRNDETLFESDNKQLCVNFMDNIWEENTTDYIYTWLEEVNE